MPSSRTRRVTEGGLKREYVHAPLHSVCGMAVPQLVWVNVEPCGSSPLSANISNRLSSEMSLATGARKYIAVSFASAKRVKKLERVTGHSNSPCFGSFAKQVDLAAIGEHFDVLPTDSRDLGNSATQQVTPLNQGVIALSLAVEMSSHRNRRHQQPHLFMRQTTRCLRCMQQRTRWHRITRHTCDRATAWF